MYEGENAKCFLNFMPSKQVIHIISFEPITSKASANSFHELSMTSVSIDVIGEFWRATKRELVDIVWIDRKRFIVKMSLYVSSKWNFYFNLEFTKSARESEQLDKLSWKNVRSVVLHGQMWAEFLQFPFNWTENCQTVFYSFDITWSYFTFYILRFKKELVATSILRFVIVYSPIRSHGSVISMLFPTFSTKARNGFLPPCCWIISHVFMILISPFLFSS